MTDIVERLRSTTEQMANNCSVNMTLWCEHSGAALKAAAEIERLRLSLSEASAAGRAEGMEEAARYHDRQIADLEERIAENNAYCEKHGINVSGANNYCRELQVSHRLSAAYIRAAKEKP